MPPFAVCSNVWCPLLIDLYEERDGPSRFPPEACPACESPLRWYCQAPPLADIRNGKPTLNKQLCLANSSAVRGHFVPFFPNGDDKMPYALCSNSNCEYSIELHARTNGTSVETPLSCPRCKRPLISTCPECGFLLMGTPGATICAVCRADIRLVFLKRLKRAQSA